jgi:hypothetical protein
VSLRAAALSGLGALWLCACSFAGSSDGDRFRCVVAADCPAGRDCVDGYCAGPGGAEGDAAAPAADGSDTDGCSPVDSFIDQFADASRWQEFGAENALCRGRIEGGVAILTKEDSGPPCGLRSLDAWDLDGADLSIQLVESDSLPVAGVEVGTDTGGWLGLYLLDDFDLVVAARMGDGLTTIDSISYDPDQHRFWRLSFAGGRFEWYTAQDGSTWDEVGSGPLPDGLARECARVQLRVAGDAGAADDSIRFDNLNGTP